MYDSGRRGDDRRSVAMAMHTGWSIRILTSGMGPVGKTNQLRFGSFFFMREGTLEYCWEVRLPRGTCVIGAFYRSKRQRGADRERLDSERDSFEILDVLYLNGKDVSNLPLSERLASARKLIEENGSPSSEKAEMEVRMARSMSVSDLLADREVSLALIGEDRRISFDMAPYRYFRR